MDMLLPLPHYTIQDLESFPDDGQRYELLQGLLLVTPQAGSLHQFLASRLVATLDLYLGERAHIAAPGAIQLLPDTHLEPDVLVIPGHLPANLPWSEYREHWLAIEIYSRSSRLYDHDYKRDAYLALGVREVWLVDPTERSLLVSEAALRDQRITGTLSWHPAGMEKPLELSLDRLFRGLGEG
jgi:Uma2 family endonuclease